MRTTIRIVLLLVTAGSSGCAPRIRDYGSSASVRNATPTADQVIAWYYDAVGGYNRLKSVRTRHLRGQYVEGALHATTEVFQERPQQRRVNLYTRAFDHFEGFDGQTWEYHRDSGKVEGHLIRDPLGSAAELAQRRGSEFDPSFVDYKARGFEAILLARARLNNVDTYHVRIARTDGWMLDYYFDVRTHLLTALKKAMPVHAEGQDVESLTFYSDWRRVSGLLVPFTGEERNVVTGAVMNSLHWDVIEHNVPIARKDILPP
jgi:hypothetical protein